ACTSPTRGRPTPPIPSSRASTSRHVRRSSPSPRPTATSSTSTCRVPMRRPSSRSDDERHEEGMAVRRAVLGDEHVDRAQARTTDFTADFQDFITRCAWGDVWTRPGLDRRMRSAVTLAVLMTLRAEEEIAMHVRAALRNGLTADEIGEVLLHGAIYAGVPAANTAFAVASACSPRPTPTGDGDPGRDRGGRPGRVAAGPPAAPAGHRVRRARGALARVRRGAGARRRAR